MLNSVELTNDTLISAHLLLALAQPPRAEFPARGASDPESKPAPSVAQTARALVEAETELQVKTVGGWDLFVVGRVSEFERVFGAQVHTVDGGPHFGSEPIIPAAWRGVIRAVVLPPRVALPI